MSKMTPKEIVKELDRFVVGQDNAKKAVAIALRNRWRRLQLPEDMRQEITPKNILMIGPTGVGKTEIARRLANLAKAPFIKIEATKFTEVGYVGKDVDSIIRDLTDVAVKMYGLQEKQKVHERASALAEKRVLEVLLPSIKEDVSNTNKNSDDKDIKVVNNTYQLFRDKLRTGKLDDKEIDIDISVNSFNLEIMGPPGMEDMTNQLQNIFSSLNSDRKKRRKVKVKKALRLLLDEEASKLINKEDIKAKAVEAVEQKGIVFIDEIDKVCRRSDTRGGDVSREGVQRDLLPLIEGSTVSTKYGMVKTDHILFFASGAFHVSKPSDLIPELQGRLPIRVELCSLKINDFIRILTEPDYSLIKQYVALIKTENITIKFTDSAIRKIAEISCKVNEEIENIGARRLHTVLERLLEEVSFDSTDLKDKNLIIDDNYVDSKLENFVKNRNLSRYIL